MTLAGVEGGCTVGGNPRVEVSRSLSGVESEAQQTIQQEQGEVIMTRLRGMNARLPRILCGLDNRTW